MNKQLLKYTEVYRLETEPEALLLIDEEQQKASEKGYKITKMKKDYKTKKSKGEVIEEWYIVTIEKSFEE